MEMVEGWAFVFDDDTVPYLYKDTLTRTYIEGLYKDTDGQTFHLGIDFFTNELAAVRAMKQNLKMAQVGHRLTLDLIEARLAEVNVRLDQLANQVKPEPSKLVRNEE